MRRRRLFVVAVAGVQLPVTVLVGFATNVAVAQHRWPGWLELVRAHPWPALAALEALTVCLAVLVSVLSGRDPDDGDPNLAGVADDLAVAVQRQWNDEAEVRQLNDPYPMPVRWDPADPDVVAAWPALVKLATTGAGWSGPVVGTWANDPAGLAGTDNDLVDVLDRVPTRRLVVLGKPGAGKTILLVRLVLDLLSRRRPGGPVPVLLPLAAWNPEDQDLRSWIVRRLITDHSGLAEPAPGGAGVTRARALLDAGLIMPVLDGAACPGARGGGLPGNLRFVVGLVEALVDNGADLQTPALGGVPEKLARWVRTEVARLDPSARAVVELLAAVGDLIDPEDLARIAGPPIEDIALALEQFVRSGMVVEQRRDDHSLGYQVAHPITREVLCTDIGGTRRRVMHRRTAGTLLESGREEAVASHLV